MLETIHGTQRIHTHTRRGRERYREILIRVIHTHIHTYTERQQKGDAERGRHGGREIDTELHRYNERDTVARTYTHTHRERKTYNPPPQISPPSCPNTSSHDDATPTRLTLIYRTHSGTGSHRPATFRPAGVRRRTWPGEVPSNSYHAVPPPTPTASCLSSSHHILGQIKPPLPNLPEAALLFLMYQLFTFLHNGRKKRKKRKK